MSVLGNAIYVGGGGGGDRPSNPIPPEKDVNFYDDYDGTLYASYTAAEFANLTAMPANPTHPGLTSQGWNWDLADAQTYVASNGLLNIGQSYVTDDNKTRIYVYLTAPALGPTLSIAVNGTCTVNWGDGTTATTLTGTSTSTLKNANHTYAAEGGYCITLDAGEGQIGISGAVDYVGSKLFWGKNTTSPSYAYLTNANTPYQNAVLRIELGNNVKFNNYALSHLNSLRNITIPTGYITAIPTSSFYYCRSLLGVTIPKGVTSIGNYAFSSTGISYASLPQNNPTLGVGAFVYTLSLKTFSFPSGKTTTGENVLFTQYTNDTTIADALSRVALPSSIKTISSQSFCRRSRLIKITFGTAVATIEGGAFAGCYNLAEIHFKRATPPTVSNSSAFQGLPTTCKIYVPTGKLSAYTSATNMPSSSTYTYVEE